MGKVNALHVKQQYLYSSQFYICIKQSVMMGGGNHQFFVVVCSDNAFLFSFFHSNSVCQSVLKQCFVLF